MSSPCPGMDYVENAKRSKVTSPGYGPLGSEPMPEGEPYPGGDAVSLKPLINKAVDARTVPSKPIGDMTAREFLHFLSRNPETPSSKRKVLAGIITGSDANYQAFIDIVAFHMLDNSSDFMLKVMESGAKEIQETQQRQVLSLLNLLGERR
jgi:hypothetical protein